MLIKKGKIIIKTDEDLLEITNRSLVFVIRNEPKKLMCRREGNLIVLYDNDTFVSESHYEWYLNDKTLVFTNVTACENYLREERNCELIAEALYAFRKENGRLWKKKLIESYENGNDNEPSLRRFRNQYDFSLLYEIKNTSTVREIIHLLLNITDK